MTGEGSVVRHVLRNRRRGEAQTTAPSGQLGLQEVLASGAFQLSDKRQGERMFLFVVVTCGTGDKDVCVCNPA